MAFFFLFPFPFPFLFFFCLLFNLCVNLAGGDQKPERVWLTELRWGEGSAGRPGWGAAPRPAHKAGRSCLSPWHLVPQDPAGRYLYGCLPLGEAGGDSNIKCMRLITFMAKTPESVGNTEIQKVLEPSWIIQVCSRAGGQGVPMVGFFTCWDLPQKCVLTILWTINKNSHGKQLSKTVISKRKLGLYFPTRSSRNCDYSELPLDILVNIWEIPSASCCPKSGKPGTHQLTHSHASAFGLIATA